MYALQMSILMENNLEHIINGCIQNKQSSQTALFNMFYNKMLHVSLKYTQNEHQAQDIAQLSFIKIFNRISQYSCNNSIEGWMRKIVSNTAIDEIRKDKSKNNIVDIDIAHLKSEEKKYSEDFLDTILLTIEKLPDSYRKVFKLYVLEERPHKEVAEMLGICEGTSKSNLFKAKAKLRDFLKNELVEEYF
jgi:RNA polymerase sigma factor (sigma-70 family)